MENRHSPASLRWLQAERDVAVDSRETFDHVAALLGRGIPRREALTLVCRGLIGAALAEMGIASAWAATCQCNGQNYDPQTACCTPAGIQQKHPIANLSACPDRVARSGPPPVPNGCGAQGGAQFPGRFGAADFTLCCNGHDLCWGTCNSAVDARPACDNTFHACLRRSCELAYSGGGILTTMKRDGCYGTALAYYNAVSSRFGTPNFEAGQQGACDCCGTAACPQPPPPPGPPGPQSCAGGMCGSLPPCAGGGDCACLGTAEGTGACIHATTPCFALRRCSTTAECPAFHACLTSSCCGRFGVCGPLCGPFNVTSAPGYVPSPGEPTLGG